MLLCPICERGSIAVSNVSMSANIFFDITAPWTFSLFRIVQAWCRIYLYFVPCIFLKN